MKKAIIILVGMLLTSQVCFAGDYSPYAKINFIQTANETGFFVYLNDNTFGCTGGLVHIYKDQYSITQKGVDYMYSAALTAYTTDMKVSIWYEGSGTSCYGTIIRLDKSQ